MTIILTQTHRFTSEGLYSPPGAMWSYFYDGTLYFASKYQQPFTAIIKLGRARTIFNMTLIVFVWKKK